MAGALERAGLRHRHHAANDDHHHHDDDDVNGGGVVVDVSYDKSTSLYAIELTATNSASLAATCAIGIFCSNEAVREPGSARWSDSRSWGNRHAW